MDRLDPASRVAVFIDGQNVYKTCRERYGHGYVHPVLLAPSVLVGRKLAFVRYYSGIHDPHVNPAMNARAHRRHSLIKETSVHVEERPLRYRAEWGIVPEDAATLPDPKKNSGARLPVQVSPYNRAREKGIDLKIGADVIELSLRNVFDAAVIFSTDEDLCEVPKIIGLMGAHLQRKVWVEAAVFNDKRQPRKLAAYAYTHQITRADFDTAKDNFDYKSELDPTHRKAFVQACVSHTPAPMSPGAGPLTTTSSGP